MTTERPVREWTGHRSVVHEVVETAVHANLIVAAAATAVALTTAAIVGLPIEPRPMAFVCVASWFAYTANRFTDRAEDVENMPGRAAFVAAYGRPLLVLGGIGYATGLVLTAVIAPRMLPVALVPLVGIGLYATDRCRRSFVLKNGIVGAVWALIPVGLATYYGAFDAIETWVVAGVVFWHIALAAMLFDIKDIPGDRAVGTRTLPVRIGAVGTARVVVAGTIPVWIAVAWAGIELAPRMAVLGLYPLHLVLAAGMAAEDRGPLFFGVGIDGEHIAIAAIALLVAT